MRIELLFNAGIDNRNQLLLAGGVYDVDEALALDLLKRGRAVKVEIKPRVETAVAGPPDNAALRIETPRRKPGRPRKVVFPTEG